MPPLRGGTRPFSGRVRLSKNPGEVSEEPQLLRLSFVSAGSAYGGVVDFACKINSLHLWTTSGWPKVLPQKSGDVTFFDTLWPGHFLAGLRLSKNPWEVSEGPQPL